MERVREAFSWTIPVVPAEHRGPTMHARIGMMKAIHMETLK
jgi:hypothetical protein